MSFCFYESFFFHFSSAPFNRSNCRWYLLRSCDSSLSTHLARTLFRSCLYRVFGTHLRLKNFRKVYLLLNFLTTANLNEF